MYLLKFIFVRSNSFTSYQDPFEQYKERLAKRIARQNEPESLATTKKHDDGASDINWFGVKVGADTQENGASGGAVGKYLNVNANGKRSTPVQSSVDEQAEEPKKKRKLGFGNFEGW